MKAIVVSFRDEQRKLQRALTKRTMSQAHVKVILVGDNVYGDRFTHIDESRVRTDHMSNEQYRRYIQWRDEVLLTRLQPGGKVIGSES